LPKETTDFMPQEGIEANQVSLAPGGGVQVEASFPSGVHIVSIGFKVEARFGHAMLTLVPENEVASLTVLVPRGSGVTLTSPTLIPQEGQATADPQYESFAVTVPLPAGEAYGLQVEGIPEGRDRLWWVGGAICVLLLGLSIFMAWRTKPEVRSGTGEELFVG